MSCMSCMSCMNQINKKYGKIVDPFLIIIEMISIHGVSTFVCSK